MKIMYIVVLLYVLLVVYARKVPFCPATGRLDTALTAVKGKPKWAILHKTANAGCSSPCLARSLCMTFSGENDINMFLYAC